MKSKPIPIVLAILVVVLTASSFLFYQTSSSEKRLRLQKEHELATKQTLLESLEAKVAELNQSLSNYRETSQKRINALEMSAREKEEASKSIKDELELLKKEKETALKDALEKNANVSDLTDQLTTLQKEKESLAQEIVKLKEDLKVARQPREALSDIDSAAPQEPFGMTPDKDLGASIDPVNLGEIVVSKASGRAARVQEVNALYDFIVIDAGEKDGIREGAVMNVVRHNNLIGKAVVRHTRAGACAALILPEWKKSPIEKGDLITKF